MCLYTPQYWPFSAPPEATILGNGEYPTHNIPLQIIENSKYIVCCDGSADKLLAHNIIPNLIVGDCDSVSSEVKHKYCDIIRQINEQDTNDQTKAVKTLLSQNKKRITIVGATGNREDHTIGNIALLVEYNKMGTDIAIYTNYGVLFACYGAQTFSSRPNQQISIFNVSCKTLKSNGLTYQIYPFTNWWQGTLNNAYGNQFSIEADGDYIVMISY